MKTPNKIVTTDAEIEAAVAAHRAENVRSAVHAFYDKTSDIVGIKLSDGTEFRLPRASLQGLQEATSDELAQIELLGPGTGIYWPKLDVSHDIPGLLDGIFGTRRWLAENGRKGGLRTSAVKAHSSRKNGKLGGRPSAGVSLLLGIGSATGAPSSDSATTKKAARKKPSRRKNA